ncbi:bifunctional 2-C-methyl-D-erythritol 4-phosphate cytidylyltransferase/2-C-methyl-D-erythritol 2,4-cyclodiphosphate synthase [Terricaulis sp.]|uniref:bifunctional 2-C-methyl-D-erythritol 4-phosphate cytidylyltransferase/2-C-methyl-D-erythritol 2,4-cyclodiphosphate synthase n=1 Tax=Terricaulis sp. TaxID=2768686 RepID=UPI002AC6DD58|nr:bifunctional 2-C-methyl-D-erythritol 4-phosphate cytidylyltransferase/2-C-methyl-D-erythritol 2,4-cyclodiphosphate synthase [Terricaulis sp.]MDZ4692682.1 bifunctional 2-C-methyl-D-erythritol 4-phosphate cytidylyltransferase/2-C-methyl-D-erythritol 2,4-cyclodiphosphate synthase [Terricaulis sp.]
MTITAIIVAGGRGERAGGALPKQYQRLLGKPVLTWSVEAFAAAGVDQIVVVRAAEHATLAEAATQGRQVEFVSGGATRTASVRAGLAEAGSADIILIHDAARPGLTSAMARALIVEIENGASAAAPAVPVADSLLRTDAEGRVDAEIDRTGAMRVQTPQAFRGDTLRAAYAAANESSAFGDDISVVRAFGVQAKVIPGDQRLMKITHPEDLAIVERIMGGERIVCVGSGIDAHRFGPGAFVTLCGVQIPHDKGLVGHSDADAGWHALVDAILGALGEGDIGAHFPPSDPQWKGADSERFLRHAAELAAERGARISHVDITLVCERPKIGPHRESMRARTAEVLGLPLSRVSVKATTTERMGFLGREEGLAAQATATLDRPL